MRQAVAPNQAHRQDKSSEKGADTGLLVALS